MLILIKGAGDLATGIAHRLFQCGFRIVMTEIAQPTTVRCTVAFSQAVYNGSAQVEGVTARLASCAQEVLQIAEQGEIPVVVDAQAELVPLLKPDVLVDAVIAKRNIGTKMTDAAVVVGVGPGFTAGVDCHAVVETKRGHDLGRVLYDGWAVENTGIPGNIGGYTVERIIRAGADGCFVPVAGIGQIVKKGDIVAEVNGVSTAAQIDGVVRGMLPAGTPVHKGMKSGDIDPRGEAGYCFSISDKARSIGGGVVEAVLHLYHRGGLRHG